MNLKNIDWFDTLLTIIIIIFVLAVGAKMLINYQHTNDSWKVHSINYGFAIVENTEGEQVLVRNPIPNLKAGDAVIVRGFTLDSNFPYIDSRKETK